MSRGSIKHVIPDICSSMYHVFSLQTRRRYSCYRVNKTQVFLRLLGSPDATESLHGIHAQTQVPYHRSPVHKLCSASMNTSRCANTYTQKRTSSRKGIHVHRKTSGVSSAKTLTLTLYRAQRGTPSHFFLRGVNTNVLFSDPTVLPCYF